MLVLMGIGFFLVRELAASQVPLPSAPVDVVDARSSAPLKAPAADEATKEEKRFNRTDKDKNGAIAKAEFLFTRQRAFARLDANGDGTISFDEYAAKTSEKFAKADGDKSGVLNKREFATTRVIRKAKPARADCPPASKLPQPATSENEDSDA
jgi:hypothetical protein